MQAKIPQLIRLFFVMGLVLTWQCSEKPTVQNSKISTRPSQAKDSAFSKTLFVDIAKTSGLEFVHQNGMQGDMYLTEIIGAGAAFLDYDRDGDLDIYLVQSTAFSPTTSQRSDAGDRLYRNDLTVLADGTRQLTFTDVTAEAGISPGGNGMGVAVGDYNNDGWVDLYVTQYGPNLLYRNLGDGRFENVAQEVGVDDSAWGVSAAFADLDADGHLDLFVGNYCDFSERNHRVCHDSVPDYCHPLAYPASPDKLFRNRGDGTFEDISSKAGLDEAYGRALGVTIADLNGDQRLDIYVANDGSANQFWVAQSNFTYQERGMISGNAVNESGLPEAGMGLDAGDFDGDGDFDLIVTHLAGETNTLYVNDGSGFFDDRTTISGLGATSMPFTGFGTAWFDYDNDGLLDLLVVNGSVTKLDDLVAQGDPFPFHQKNQIFHNLGQGQFEDVSATSGKAFELSETSRGAAFGDIDNDGDLDVLITNNNGPVRLLQNLVGQDNQWIGLSVLSREKGSFALGAVVHLQTDQGTLLVRRVRSDGSYASANDPRITIGLGAVGQISQISIIWPDGFRENFGTLPVGQYHTLVRGTGRPLE